MRILSPLLLILLALMVAGCTREPVSEGSQPQVAAADVSSEDILTDPIARGERTFSTYCTGCHGGDATGSGPAAEALSSPPTNLRLLAQNNNGTFPAEQVYQSIDGREEFIAHGTREMPFWGNIWIEKDGEPRAEDAVTQEISEVVEYLRSIQE